MNQILVKYFDTLKLM